MLLFARKVLLSEKRSFFRWSLLFSILLDDIHARSYSSSSHRILRCTWNIKACQCYNRKTFWSRKCGEYNVSRNTTGVVSGVVSTGLLKLNSNIHSRQTRYCNFNLTSPRYNRETEGGRTFTVTTCKAWNSLSLPVRQRDSVDSLKKALWNDFFKQQQNLDHFSI